MIDISDFDRVSGDYGLQTKNLNVSIDFFLSRIFFPVERTSLKNKKKLIMIANRFQETDNGYDKKQLFHRNVGVVVYHEH